MKHFISFLLSAIIAFSVSAETIEATLDRVAPKDEVDKKINDYGSENPEAMELITNIVDLSLGPVFEALDKTINEALESMYRVLDSRRLQYAANAREAEKALEKATPDNLLDLRIKASVANRIAGRHQRAAEILYQALEDEKNEANRRRIFYSLIECYFDTRDYSGLNSVLNTLGKMNIPDEEERIKTLWYKGRYCFETGDNKGCNDNITKALDVIISNENGTIVIKNAEYAPYLQLLQARLMIRLGRGEEVLKSLDEVADMIEKTDDPQCLASYLRLAAAEIYGNLGKMDYAFNRCSRALSSVQKKYPGGSQFELQALITAGNLALQNSLLPPNQRVRNRFTDKGAFHYLNGCLLAAKRMWDKGYNPQYRELNRKLALASLVLSREKGEVNGKAYKRLARNIYSNELETMRKQLRADFTSMSDGQRTDYMQLMGELFNDIYNFAEYDLNNKKTRKMVYDACLLHKSMLLSFSRSISRLVKATGDNGLIAEYDRLTDMKTQLVALEQADDYSRSNSLRSSIDELERKIISAVSASADPTSFMATKCNDVQKSLGKKDIAIEFYTFTDNQNPKHGLRERYVWLTSDDDPKIQPLSYRKGDINLNEKFQQRALYMQLWKPLVDKKVLKPGMQIFFSPAGRWNGIPMEYLPCGDGKYMNEIYNMVRVSTTRSFPANSALITQEAVLFGGLDYNMGIDEMTYMRDELAASRGNGSGKPWAYLPGTFTEVTNIGRLFEESGSKATSFIGVEGLEEAFKALDGKSHKVIHIATHGYCREQSNDEFASISESYNDALDRAGLVFSGANQSIFGLRAEDLDDGLLTAREIALLDLSETDMVVMSACESGVGGSNAEGVFGLQRGFKLAGAGTLVMSLWKVNDEATETMMTSFYRGLLNGLDKRTAFRQAQAEVRKGTFGGVSGADPYIWGAFVIMD